MEDELEEAHQLQISMLPDNVPEHPSAEVNWSMKTATEVGGDYYDYRITDDDRLTLILGDATGHGMQAGTLVTATKSLFQSLTTEGNLADTVSKMSVNLKSMNLHRLGMALTLVELDGRRLRYCAAGIPPILIYRAQEDTVEEGETGGLPLGLTTRGNYHQTELTLESGDALLLMSDGLAERTNEAEEEFGYQRVQDLFHEVATDTPAEICRKMAAGGDAWAAGKEQDDDVSFLAVRLR
jgi:serine phosphatase RsbU (regulator of sigma subunit)